MVENHANLWQRSSGEWWADQFPVATRQVTSGRASRLKSRASPDPLQSHRTKIDTCEGHLSVLKANFDFLSPLPNRGPPLHLLLFFRNGG